MIWLGLELHTKGIYPPFFGILKQRDGSGRLPLVCFVQNRGVQACWCVFFSLNLQAERFVRNSGFCDDFRFWSSVWGSRGEMSCMIVSVPERCFRYRVPLPMGLCTPRISRVPSLPPGPGFHPVLPIRTTQVPYRCSITRGFQPKCQGIEIDFPLMSSGFLSLCPRTEEFSPLAPQ